MKCNICKNENGLKRMMITEMMHEGKEVFSYRYCQTCGTLSLEDIPANMELYYNSKYYSFNENKWENEKHVKADAFLLAPRMRGWGWTKAAVQMIFRRPKYLKYIGMNCSDKHAWILDVGCGNGDFVKYLRKHGYIHAYGIDPFTKLETEIVLRKDIFELSKAEKNKYDIIIMNHSFEHMDNPEMVLDTVKRMLKSDGVLMLRIPVCGGLAWRMFGRYWYQIDAPRHLYLYSRKALEMLAKRTGFYIKCIEYDSDSSQFLVSHLYSKGITMSHFNHEIICSTVNKVTRILYKALTLFINLLKEGDQAIFIICSEKEHGKEK